MMMSVRNCSEPHHELHNYSYEGKPTDLDVANTEEVVTSPDLIPTSEPNAYTGTNIEINGIKQEVAEVLWAQYLNKHEEKIPVKALRKLIPQGFKECYHQNDDDSTKKKLKHQWDDRPGDWPEDIPFVDPNNGIRTSDKSSGKSASSVHGKPGKDKLLQMFRFLKLKYEQCPREKSGKYCSETGGFDNLCLSYKRVQGKINNVILALKSGESIDGVVSELKLHNEIMQLLCKEARNGGFEKKKLFYEVSHRMEKHMDLSLEDLNYLFSNICWPDLQQILGTYKAQGSVDMTGTELQFYGVSKNTYDAPSHTITSQMLSQEMPENEGNTYFSIASEEDMKTAITQSDLVRREGNGIPLKTGINTMIDLKGVKPVQDSLFMKSEELPSCKASRQPVQVQSMVNQQDAMPTMQPVMSLKTPSQRVPDLLLVDDGAVSNMVTQPDHVQTPRVSSHSTPKVQPTEQVVSSNSSLMDVVLVVNPMENPVVNPAAHGVQLYPQQYQSAGQQGNYPVDQLDQPPDQENLFELFCQQISPQQTEVLVNLLDQTNDLACENLPYDQQTARGLLHTQTITDTQSQAIQDQQTGAREYQQTEMSENCQPFINAEEEMMKNVQSLQEDYGQPTTFFTHSKINRPSAEVEGNMDSPGTEMAVDVSPLIPLTVEEMEKSDDEMEVDSPRAGSKRTYFSYSHDHNMASGGKKTRKY